MSIWHYNRLSEKVSEEFRLTQNEGDTPIEQILLKIPDSEKELIIRLKREDQNPNGSFKDRSLAFQISNYFQKGEKSLVISSSGNAAISAVSYAKMAGINMHVFVSNEVSEDKIKRLELVSKHGDVNNDDDIEPKVTVHKSERAKSDGMKFALANNLTNLRGSTDDSAIEGFKSLGYEIGKVTDIVDSVFIPCSSGTSTLGVYRGLEELGDELIGQFPKIHVVQTTKVNPIAREFDRNFEESEKSLADAIVDNVAHRKDEVVELVKKSQGSGWVISDIEILEAKELLEAEKIFISNTAALSVAGIIKAVRSNSNINSPLALISGL